MVEMREGEIGRWWHWKISMHLMDERRLRCQAACVQSGRCARRVIYLLLHGSFRPLPEVLWPGGVDGRPVALVVGMRMNQPRLLVHGPLFSASRRLRPT